MTLGDLRRAAELLPAGASVTLPREALLTALDESANAAAMPSVEPSTASGPGSWQERLWTAPADARMSAADVCEALGRPKSWIYRHTSKASGLPRIPHRRLDGELVFAAGDVRQWVKDRETIEVSVTRVVPITKPRIS